MVFDLLQLGEKDYRPEPLKVRRKALEKLLRGQTLIRRHLQLVRPVCGAPLTRRE